MNRRTTAILCVAAAIAPLASAGAIDLDNSFFHPAENRVLSGSGFWQVGNPATAPNIAAQWTSAVSANSVDFSSQISRGDKAINTHGYTRGRSVMRSAPGEYYQAELAYSISWTGAPETTRLRFRSFNLGEAGSTLVNGDAIAHGADNGLLQGIATVYLLPREQNSNHLVVEFRVDQWDTRSVISPSDLTFNWSLSNFQAIADPRPSFAPIPSASLLAGVGLSVIGARRRRAP